MGEGVIAEIMPFGEYSLNESRIGGAVLADNKEGRVDALLLEDVQDFGRPVRARSIVERQRDFARHFSSPPDHKRGGHFRVGLSRDRGVRVVDFDRARACRGFSRNLQKLAASNEIDVGARVDGFERGWRRRAIVSGHDLPDGWIFGAEPPQSVASRAIFIGGAQMVISCHRVEEPDTMGTAIFQIREARIERLGIEFDRHL